jgi:DNA-binding protein
MQTNTETETSRDTIFIGKKPLMTYVTAAIMQLTTSDGPITIKARGMSISTAVSVAQIVTRQMSTCQIGNVIIGSESLQSQDGRTRNVSTIEIQVTKTK